MGKKQKGGNFRGKRHQRAKKQDGFFLPFSFLGQLLGSGGRRRRAPPRRRRPPQYYRPPQYRAPPPQGRIQKRYRQRGGFLTDSINTGILDHYGKHKHPTESKKNQKGGYMHKRVKNAFW
ncbi:Hypothetical predicted protein [Paramuricea clavata]|uniref:Uncharacterized protein n=1 Tax=Paramuricea clavata TaxID=317549 RepID=A0A7D9HC74_PARCT|nr:Hypothetical predicted protein [Paramuricea clavata]